jgi:hypothetical protein
MVLYSTFWLMFTFTASNNHHIGLAFTSVQLFEETLTNINTMYEEIKRNSSSGRFQAPYKYNHLLPND